MFYDSEWADMLYNDLYNGYYYLLAGDVYIVHEPQRALDNAKEVSRQTFLHMCSLLKIDVEQLQLKPIKEPEEYSFAEAPALSDSVKNLLGVDNGNNWLYTPKNPGIYYLYNAPVPGTDCSFAVKYIDDKDIIHEKYYGAVVSYSDYYHERIMDCFIKIYEDRTIALQEEADDLGDYGDFKILADNVSIYVRNCFTYGLNDLYDAGTFYSCARHLCSMLGIDYDALDFVKP